MQVGTQRAVRVCAPWRTAAYAASNGAHPLLAPLLERPSAALEFVAADPSRLCGAQLERASGELVDLALELREAFGGHAVVSAADIASFVKTRDLATQLAVPEQAELVFHHTTPRCSGRRPWVLHLESITPLFLPFLRHGQLAGVRLRAQPVYWLVRHLLEQPNCRAIFSHLPSTARTLGAVFESPSIAAKTHWIPLGVQLPPELSQPELPASAARAPQQPFTVLFTNSWHQDPTSFYLRGGADLVTAFRRASREHGALRLILRTALPDDLPRGLREGICGDPRIEWLPQPVSEAELFALYLRADAFAVPGAGLHSLSVARAMHCGAICIASDAPGYEELLRDGENAVLVPGRRAAVYTSDPESGWLRDDYRSVLGVDDAYAERLTQVLLRLARSGDEAQRLRENARSYAREQLSFEPWARGVEQLLCAAARS